MIDSEIKKFSKNLHSKKDSKDQGKTENSKKEDSTDPVGDGELEDIDIQFEEDAP